ncbi:MAG TPA: CcdB family protein [Burkholderiaceae bacterium]|nr:CcdB family protein [Burkholderiaceae bacterium]
MAQFNVYENPSVAQREGFPYLVVLQNDQLDQFSTRFVMPLARLHRPPAHAPRRLAQSVTIGGEELQLAPHLCAPLPARLLRKPVATLASEATALLDALDAVIAGV